MIIPARYCGPASSGNGGYTAGLVAGLLAGDGAVRVMLKLPPPLETELREEVAGDVARLWTGDRIVAEATQVEAVGEWPGLSPVPLEAAEAAMTGYRGLVSHPFPRCYSCGVDRTDGLGLRPGPVGERSVATAWRPAEVTVAEVWAALDCPSAWSTDILGQPKVLGTMTARIDALPEVGGSYVVVGTHLGDDGRKSLTASALYDDTGRRLAHASHIWIAIDPADF